MKNINIIGTSFHDGYVFASCNEIKEKLNDEPSYIISSDDPEYTKVHIEFNYKLKDGTIFTIYDWKQYDYDINNLDEKLYYHIGTFTTRDTKNVIEFLKTKGLTATYEPFNF